MWTDSIKHFHFWCQKTLPLVYDDSLSYYEVLAKLTKHLNELTTLVNEIGDELERYEGVTDDRLDTLETWRTEVDTWRVQIDEWKTDVNTWIEQTDAWKQSTENHLTAHDNWISYATGLINNTIMPFIEDMTARVGDIENRLSGAEDDIDALEGRMDTAEDDIDTLQSDVTSLDGRLDDAESAITGLDGRLDTAEDDIDTLQSDVTSLDGRLDTAEDDIDALEGRMDTAEDDIDTLQSDVTGLDSRLDDAESAITGLDGRLDTAENDIDTLQSDTTGLANRMSTAEDSISKIEKRINTITGVVIYDNTNNIWLFEISSPWDATFLRTNIDNSSFLLTEVSKRVQLIFTIGSAGYDYDNLVLSFNLTPLQYNGQNVVIVMVSPGTNVTWYNEFDTSGDTFILNTMPSNFAKINRFVGSKTLNLPTPHQSDDGKVVAYNDTLKNYELITSPTPHHTYSTTEQIVGTWVDGRPVYEITLTTSTAVQLNDGSFTQLLFNENEPSDINFLIDAIYTSLPPAKSSIRFYCDNGHFSAASSHPSGEIIFAGSKIIFKYVKTTV